MKAFASIVGSRTSKVKPKKRLSDEWASKNRWTIVEHTGATDMWSSVTMKAWSQVRGCRWRREEKTDASHLFCSMWQCRVFGFIRTHCETLSQLYVGFLFFSFSRIESSGLVSFIKLDALRGWCQLNKPVPGWHTWKRCCVCTVQFVLRVSIAYWQSLLSIRPATSR